jgi:hypothetical protein
VGTPLSEASTEAIVSEEAPNDARRDSIELIWEGVRVCAEAKGATKKEAAIAKDASVFVKLVDIERVIKNYLLMWANNDRG